MTIYIIDKIQHSVRYSEFEISDIHDMEQFKRDLSVVFDDCWFFNYEDAYLTLANLGSLVFDEDEIPF